LVSANTVEAQILAKAASKRKLEKLVIQKGKFRSLAAAAAASGDNAAELADLLTREEGVRLVGKEGDKIFSDEELEGILDRSDEAYERAEAGSGVAGRFEVVQEKRQDDVFATRTGQ
jgi:ATP-dependent DNA helicase